MKNKSRLIAVFSAFLILAARGQAPSADNTGNPHGTYALVSVDGNKVPCSVQHEGQTLAIKSGAFHFNPDGTCNSKMLFVPPSGREATTLVRATYTRHGPELTMQWEGAGTTTGTLTGDTFTMNNEGMMLAYQKPAAGRSPVISRVSPMLARRTQTIVIEGSGFGDKPPKMVPAGDAEDTDSRNGLSPALAINDHGRGPDSWEAGLASDGNFDLIGVKLVKWSDTKITLAGFGSYLGEQSEKTTWKIAPGDPIEITVFAGENTDPAKFKLTVLPNSAN